MKAVSPLDGKTYYFVDKCLPFGASISCALFQEVSDAIAHLFRTKTGQDVINYLDDYFFADFINSLLNNQIKQFLFICEQIGMPISHEKTFWATTQLTFLGLLIDTIRQLVLLLCEKVIAAIEWVKELLGRKNKKLTVRELQKLCGTFNFFSKAIIPA